ncbi:MAG: glycine betaine ABC transporter substrate-binding protein, partial [Dehalococcoidia bacterium]
AVPDPDVTFAEARSRMLEHGVTLLPSAPAQNSNAFVVTRALSAERGLTRISDLAAVAAEMTLGAPPECPRRALCAVGLSEVYGVTFGEFEPLDLDGRVAALEAGTIDVALLFSTDAVIAARDWVVLEDDRGLQPAENVSLAIRTEVLERSDVDIEAIVANVSAQLTTQELRELNRQVQVDRVPAEDVARTWLEARGLIETAAGA